VAGTNYEAIHYSVFPIFLLLSTIKFYGLISTVPKPILLAFLNVTEEDSPPHL